MSKLYRLAVIEFKIFSDFVFIRALLALDQRIDNISVQATPPEFPRPATLPPQNRAI